MLLDLSRLRGSERLERRFGSSGLQAPGDAFRVRGEVSLDGEVVKDARKARLTGRLRAELECDCSRCLEAYAVPVAVSLDLLFLPASENAGDGEQEVGEDDLGVSYYHDDQIDLGEVMREQFHLALPMKPLCQPDCRGLCPVCGVNRNREACACEPAWVDPRFDALRELKTKTRT